MFFKQLYIPLEDIRIRTPDIYKHLFFPVESDLNSSASQEKPEERENDENVISEEPMSAYERMIKKNREEKMALLQSLRIDEAKADLRDIVGKMRPVKRKNTKCQKPKSPPVLRKSSRLKNRSAKTVSVPVKSEKVIPAVMSFEEALVDSEDFYESYKVDVNIQKPKQEAKFTIYEKSVLGEMTVKESNVTKVTPSKITALTWHPSPEQMIIAAGDDRGHLGLWNVESENSYVFKTHLARITNLQFNPYYQAQLISSSSDGVLRCGDMVQHNFFEVYNVSGETDCTYFDVLSATTYLVALRNGEVALVDERSKSKSCEKKHKCCDNLIRTVNIHPTDKNVFVTAASSIRLWDLRNLQSTPVADIAHHEGGYVHSAFFSPVTGNSILAYSSNEFISIFDSTNLTSDVKVRVEMKYNYYTERRYTPFERAPLATLSKLTYQYRFRPTWLPNSEEAFVVGSTQIPRRIEIYDKNICVYMSMMHENFDNITLLNAFHPTRPALAGANSCGKVIVFT